MSNPEIPNKPMQFPSFGKAKRQQHWLMGLVAAGLLGTAITVFLIVQSKIPKADLTKQTVVVQSKDITVQIKANATVQSLKKINLGPKEQSRIEQLYVDEGVKVKQGQLIARMDSQRIQQQVNQYKALLAKVQADLAEKRAGSRPEEIGEAKARVATAQANVAQAQARLNRATEELQRNQLLAQRGAISLNSLGDFSSKEREAKADLEAQLAGLREQRQTLEKLRNGTRKEQIVASEADVAQAEAQLRSYQTQLEDTLIRAPFAGTITRKFAQEGDFVTPTTSASSSDGATSASIAELSSGLEVEAKIPEASIARIKTGQQVEIRSDAYPNKTFQGSVRLVAPRAIQDSSSQGGQSSGGVTSFRVKVALKTGQDLLKGGMNVKLNFISNKIYNALVVPLAAIVTQKDGQTGVWIPNENNIAQLRPVIAGSVSGNQIQIIKGVSKGERILLSPPEGQPIPGVDTMP
ncbi:efflux RND transporter periplasmic adaptor subunit [Nostoc sp.]|uniref:efflux RND transporter periplasmic adaptor subunit n=1 Tax=Nostoc sp. TaxID=1180 RepID=UPI002FF965D3